MTCEGRSWESQVGSWLLHRSKRLLQPLLRFIHGLQRPQNGQEVFKHHPRVQRIASEQVCCSRGLGGVPISARGEPCLRIWLAALFKLQDPGLLLVL